MGIVTILIAFFTEVLLKDIGGWLFFIFALFMILAGFFAIYHLKETKGLSNEELEVLYAKKGEEKHHKEKGDEEERERLIIEEKEEKPKHKHHHNKEN